MKSRVVLFLLVLCLSAFSSSAIEEVLGGRSTKDRPDDVEGYQIHIVYAIARNGEDEKLDTNGMITKSIANWNGWLAEESGGIQVRIDTYQGTPDITFLRLPFTETQIRAGGSIILDFMPGELRKAGLNDRNKKYAIYYGGNGFSDICGISRTPYKVAVLYLNYCGQPLLESYTDLAMLHEIFHALGAVSDCAPNGENGHVNDNVNDLMSPTSDEMLYLDFGRDDYWGHDNEDCPNLADSPYMERTTTR